MILLTRIGFFKLLAAIGIGQASNVIQTPVQGPFSDGQGGCFTNHKHVLGDIKRVPCKEGEEYCPIGHSQKPELFTVDEVVLSSVTRRFIRQLRVCSLCGVVYTKQGG